MISDRSEFRVHIRRLFVIMIRTCYRWICSHPFLLGFVGVVYLLYRACPLLFSPLLAISPVLVCTFVLLGTILSFGEPNIIPEIETEPEATVHEAALFTAEVSRDPTVVERGGESFTVERFVSTEKDGNDDADRLVEKQLSEAEDGDGQPFDYRPLVDEILDEVKRDTQIRFEEKFIGNDGKRVSPDEQWRNVGGSSDEMMEDSKEDLVSPWRPMRHEEGEDDDADDSLDSSSDGAESSSPDPSMTEIIPMLDELHPLLHSENPRLGIADLEGSDATSEEPDMSSSDSDEGTESDVNSESHGEEGDNKKEEEEEEKKEDECKSPIKWTEADQKNVMDLGSLELERNQRLESLIARRRARNNMRMVAERNLIDFDCADVPFNMPHISTARHNPFDISYDDDMGLPPIPGSAPSIMFARRNPFDLPYEPNEEKPDLKGDGFEEEFTSPQRKEPVFRRHESFSVGPSMLGGPRHDRLRPFFALERLANEGRSYYPFERQLSEVSESKVSSVPDTESICTILEDEEKKVDEYEADRETDIAKDDMASDHDEEKGHSSEESDLDEQADSKNLHHDVPEITLGSAETHVTHHEQSNMMDGEASDNAKHDEEDSSDSDSSLSEIEEVIADISENKAMLISEQKAELHEKSGTSSGGLDIHVTREMEDDYHHDEEPTFITALPSLEESAIHDLCGLVGDHHETPIYDSTPPSASRFPSFSSLSSDYKPDLPGKSGEEVQENADNEREVYSESIGPGETETSTREVGENSPHVTGEASLGIDGQNISTVLVSEFEEDLLEPSSLPLDKKEGADHQENGPLPVCSQEDLEELNEEVKEAVDTRALDVSESLVDLVSPTEEEVVSTGIVEQHLPVEHTSSPLGYDDTTEHVTTLEESPDEVHGIAETSVNGSVAEGTMQEEEDKQKDEASPQTSNADIPVDSYATLSSGAVEYAETHSFYDESALKAEQDRAQSSVSDAMEETHPNQTMDIEVDSMSASAQSEKMTPSESDREPTWSDKSVVEQSSLEPVEDQVPEGVAPESVVFSRNITFRENHDAPEDTTELSCLASDTSPSPAESPEYETPMVGEGSKAEFFQETVNEGLDHVVERDQLTDLHEVSQSPPEVITEEAERLDQLTDLHAVSQSPPEVITEEAERLDQFTDSHEVAQSPPEVITEEVERLDQFTDLHAVFQSPPEVITEEADEIKEIDEGLLSELDTIGDFGVTEVVTDSEPGPSSIGSDTAKELTEALPVLNVRSVEDIESAFQQICEGSEVEDVILPSTVTVQDQIAQENSENSTETKSDLTVVEATSKDDLDTAMNQAVVECMGKQTMSPETDGGSGETKRAVEIEPSGSLVEERSFDETNVNLNNTPEKEEEDESRPKEITASDVSSMETRSLEEIPKPSEPKEEMVMEVISERVVIPTEAIESSNVTLSDEVVTEEAKAETSSNIDVILQSPDSKETPEEVKAEEKKEKGKSDSSSSSSSSSSSDSD